MKIVWITDPHFECTSSVSPEKWINNVMDHFIRIVTEISPEMLWISGDIALKEFTFEILERIHEAIKPCKIAYSLGNHDFYYSSIEDVKVKAMQLMSKNPNIIWLEGVNPIKISYDTMLMGIDGWYDCGYGDPILSTLNNNDFFLIEGIKHRSKDDQVDIFRRLGVEATIELAKKMFVLIDNQDVRKIKILTHFSPFPRMSCDVESIEAEKNWLPYSYNRRLGDFLFKTAERYPEVGFEVICGHVHSKASIQPRENLVVTMGSARYGEIHISGIWEV